MKGLISGIKRMEIHDGDGLRSTVFFKGCPLKCLWCHNPESISFEPQNAVFKEKCISCGSCKGVDGSLAAELCPVSANVRYGVEYDVDTLVGTLMKDADYYKNSGGGVTLSGGECLAQAPFATALAKMLKKNGISVYIDTCGGYGVGQGVFHSQRLVARGGEGVVLKHLYFSYPFKSLQKPSDSLAFLIVITDYKRIAYFNTAVLFGEVSQVIKDNCIILARAFFVYLRVYCLYIVKEHIGVGN